MREHNGMLDSHVAILSERGPGKDRNEDAVDCISLKVHSLSGTSSYTFLAVADGIGSYDRAEVSSQTAVVTFVDFMARSVIMGGAPGSKVDDVRTLLRQSLVQTNETVRAHIMGMGLRLSGTTLVGACISNHQVDVASVGDSRAYLFGPTGRRRITRDHSFVQGLVETGRITEAEVLSHPRRHEITAAVGTQDSIAGIDACLYSVPLTSEELLMLSTDGVHGVLTDDEIEGVAHSGADLPVICRELVRKARNKGSNDDATILLVRIDR